MAGLPVIISEHCHGLCSIVEKAEAGLVVSLKIATLTKALADLLGDEPRAIWLGQNGRRLVVNNYTWPAIAKSMATHYSKIVNGTSSK